MSEPENNGKTNGPSAAGESHQQEIFIRYDRLTDQMEIGGAVFSLDLMLMMLGRATREIEAKWREGKALELQQKLQQVKEDAALREQLRRKV